MMSLSLSVWKVCQSGVVNAASGAFEERSAGGAGGDKLKFPISCSHHPSLRRVDICSRELVWIWHESRWCERFRER